METNYLLAAAPPNNISLKVSNLRTKIFKKFGITSALIFPSIIPLRFLTGPLAKELFTHTKSRMDTFKSISFREYEGTYLLYLSPSSFFKEVMSTVDDTGLGMKDPLGLTVKTGEFGFYLAGGKNTKYSYNGDKVMAFCTENKGLARLEWEKTTLILLKIEYSSTARWDEHIDWTILWEKRAAMKK